MTDITTVKRKKDNDLQTQQYIEQHLHEPHNKSVAPEWRAVPAPLVLPTLLLL